MGGKFNYFIYIETMNPYRPAINIEKSIKRRRLVYKVTLSLVFDYLSCLFIAGVIIFFSFVILHSITDHFNSNQSFYLAFTLTSMIAILLLTNIYFNNMLVKIKAGYEANNKVDIHAILTIKFKRLNRTINKPKLSIYYQEPKFAGVNKLVTCIFYDKDIYINIATLGKGDCLLPFSGLYNYFRAKKLTKKLKRGTSANNIES